MAIITISRQLAALGDETAHELSSRLGYSFVDKQSLEDRIRSYGVLPAVLEKFDERKPGFIASLSQERDDYLHFLKMAMFEEALERTSAGATGAVFIGRGAYAVFGGLTAVVPVFLVTCKGIRIERVRSYFHCDEKRAAAIIEQSDRGRAGFHKYFFESDWNDSTNYRLTLNTDRLHPAVAAGIIEQVVTQTVTEEAEALLQKKLIAGLLSQKVIHHVLHEREARVHFFDVTVEEGAATLYGVTNSKSVLDEAVRAAGEVPGVTSVVPAIQIVEEYNIIH
jgi:hypothetical protein